MRTRYFTLSAIIVVLMAGSMSVTADSPKSANTMNATIPVTVSASATPTSTKTNAIDGAQMIFIPAGEFTMGSNEDRVNYPDTTGDREKPTHKVYLDGYYIYKNLVTVAMYKKFCDATNRPMPEAPHAWGWDKTDYPIVNVTWDDAAAYCAWAHASLPTEAEWEKAARGTDGRAYPWGNDWVSDNCRHSFSQWGDVENPSAVGSYPVGASPYGVLDMAGNAMEWCADWFDKDYYKVSPQRNPSGPLTGTVRVLKGGSWRNVGNTVVHCSFRGLRSPGERYDYIGFRCSVHSGSGL